MTALCRKIRLVLRSSVVKMTSVSLISYLKKAFARIKQNRKKIKLKVFEFKERKARDKESNSEMNITYYDLLLSFFSCTVFHSNEASNFDQ